MPTIFEQLNGIGNYFIGNLSKSLRIIKSNVHGKMFKNLIIVSVLTPTFTMATPVTLWSEGACKFDAHPFVNHGANREFLNGGSKQKWNNYLGDWSDVNGDYQGNSPYSSTYVEDTDSTQVITIDSTALVKEWVGGTHQNQGLMLRLPTTPSSKTDIYSKEAANIENRPVLQVSSSQGQYNLSPSADTTLRSNTYQCGGSLNVLRIAEPNKTLMYFDLSVIPEGASISNASLILTTTENQYGHSQIELYRVDIAGLTVKNNILSDNYQNDYGMKYDKKVLLVESFDTDDWNRKWSNSVENSVVSQGEGNGFEPFMGNALKATVKQGDFTGLNLVYKLDDFGEDLDELNLRYYVRFGDNWKPNDTGKLPGIGGTYANTPYAAGWGGRRSTGENGWSARGTFGIPIEGNNPHSGKSPIGNYVYHADQPSNYGDSIYFQSNPLAKNEWYAVEQYVKMNTPGKNDGVIRSWINGNLVYENTTFRFRNEGYENIKIEKVWMNIYHGGKKSANQDITVYIDNVVIAKSYIGPVSFGLGKPVVGDEINKLPQIDDYTPINETIKVPSSESQIFTVSATDPEGAGITVNWYVNGVLTLESENTFTLYRNLENLEALTIEAKLQDADGGSVTKSWSVASELEKFTSVDVLQDTYLPAWTYQSRGQLDELKFTQTSNVMLEFPLTGELEIELDSSQVKSAYIVLYTYAQYGDINLFLYKSVAEWSEGTHIRDGATREYQNYEEKSLWQNRTGDWFDASDNLNGDNYYSETFVEDTDTLKKVHIEVTDLLREQLFNGENLGVFIKSGASSSKQYMYSKEAGSEFAPTLIIESF